MNLSFIIPAHNEEAALGAVLSSIHAAASGTGLAYEVLVVDDVSTDRTAEIAASHGARVVPVAFRQISRVRNAGAAASLGEILIFVDADTLVNDAVVKEAIASVRSGAVGGGAGFRFDEPIPAYARVLLPPFAWLLRHLRLAAGCFLFCTRKAFFDAGRFDESLFAGEEIALSLALRRQGRVVIIRKSVLTSGRKARTHTGLEIFSTFLRVILRGPRALRDRKRLDLWYGPRRRDVSGS